MAVGAGGSLVPAGYVFGLFTLDCRKQRLLRDGELLPLAGKTFEVLRALIERRDRLVEKDELVRLVWPDVVCPPSERSLRGLWTSHSTVTATIT
jgi:DNA-binding winged helix-turn-helix (wHTH) protein